MLSFPPIHYHEAVGKLGRGDAKAIIIPNNSIKDSQPCNSPMLKEDVSSQQYLLDNGAAASISPWAKLLKSDFINMKPYVKSNSLIVTPRGLHVRDPGNSSSSAKVWWESTSTHIPGGRSPSTYPWVSFSVRSQSNNQGS